MGVMKADLWRYCVIYIHGGIYADSDAELLCNPNDFLDDEAQIVISPEPGCNFFCQWTFAAPAKSEILKEIIDLCVYRALNWEIKGEHIIHGITGPAMFTDAIKAYLKKNNMKVFDKCKDFKNYPSKSLKVIPAEIFHRSMIRHHYAGDQGWKKERKGILF
jgi:mannosyltransferase OCH1-like enzyme